MIGWLCVTMLVASAQAPQGPAPPANGSASVDRAAIDAQVRASLVADVLPRREAFELRPQVVVELTATPTPWASIHFDGLAEGLVASRVGRVTAARAEARDAWVEVRGGRGDLRLGYGRLVWGRLDEIAPTDVINPLDVSRFLLEGRSEARLPVAFARGRFAASERLMFEGVIVPVFRRGRFDRLSERTSPFNLIRDVVVPAGVTADLSERAQLEPEVAWRNVSGGGRVEATVGRVDVAASVFRGFDGVGPVLFEVESVSPVGMVVGRLTEVHPRFTMLGADFETVAGAWALRGEVATFVDRTFAARSRPGLVHGRALDAGVGFDRRAGEFGVFGSALVHREWSAEDALVERTDVNLVGSVERSFGRERYLARAFAVVNPGDASAFLRGLFGWRARDRIALEWSGGAFLGTSDDTIGRFRTRDFVSFKLRTWF